MADSGTERESRPGQAGSRLEVDVVVFLGVWAALRSVTDADTEAGSGPAYFVVALCHVVIDSVISNWRAQGPKGQRQEPPVSRQTHGLAASAEIAHACTACTCAATACAPARLVFLWGQQVFNNGWLQIKSSLHPLELARHARPASQPVQ